MFIRPLAPDDQSTILELTVATFGPFYEESFRPLAGETVFANRHGNWREDYRHHLAGLHEPENGKYAAVAESAGTVVGYIGWVVEPTSRHGELDILAVDSAHRGSGIGTALATHAIDHIKQWGAEVVSVGTGGDAFHAPARALYEALGFTAFPHVNFTKAL